MKDLKQINLETLFHQFGRTLDGPFAQHVLWHAQRRQLPVGEMLAMIDQDIAKDKGKILRSGSVALLKFYSLLEIALLISFIPDPDGNVFWTEIRDILNHQEFRAFYEKAYPLILPAFLSRRLTEGYQLREESLQGTSGVFLAFLSMTIREQEDSDIGFFLRLLVLSDAEQGTLERLVEILKNKQQFMSRVLDATGQDDEISRALRGLDRFLGFCENFDRLLGRSKKYPLLQSAMWNYYGDLFQLHGRRIEQTLKAIIERFETWVEEEHWDEYRLDVKDYTSHMFELIDRLTSDFYNGNIPEVAEFAPLVGGSGFAEK
jgi:hypothetical protein